MNFLNFKSSLESSLDSQWYMALAALIVVLLGVRIYVRQVQKAKEQSRNLVSQFVLKLRSPLLAFVVLIAAKIGVEYRDWGNEEFAVLMRHLITIGFIALAGWSALSLIAVMRARMLKGHDITAADNYRARKMHTQVSLLYRVLSFLVILVTIALILTTFSAVNNLGKSLLASAGVAGVIIGFAAQKTIGSVFAGIQIAITQPIRIEDAVVVEGEWGWVEEITLTYVVIRIWDKRRLIVPITYFTEKPFQNWTRQEAEIIGVVIIHTDYSVPVDAMRVELDRLLSITPLWNKNISVLQVVETTNREIQLRALMTGKDSPTTFDLRCFVREGLIAWLQKNHPDALPRTRLTLEPQEEAPMSKSDIFEAAAKSSH